MDRLVQLTCQTELDSSSGDDRLDLADSLSHHPDLVRIHFPSSGTWQDPLGGRFAIRIEPRIESAFHTHPIRLAQSATRGRRYRHRVDYDPLGGHRCVATLSLGSSGAGALFCMGLDRDRSAVVDHSDELGPLDFTCLRSCVPSDAESLANAYCLPA